VNKQARPRGPPVALSALWRSYIGSASWDSSSSRWVWFYCQWVAHHQGEIFIHLHLSQVTFCHRPRRDPNLPKAKKNYLQSPRPVPVAYQGKPSSVGEISAVFLKSSLMYSKQVDLQSITDPATRKRKEPCHTASCSNPSYRITQAALLCGCNAFFCFFLHCLLPSFAIDVPLRVLRTC